MDFESNFWQIYKLPYYIYMKVYVPNIMKKFGLSNFQTLLVISFHILFSMPMDVQNM